MKSSWMTVCITAFLFTLFSHTAAHAAEPIGDFQYAGHWRNTLNLYVPNDRPGPFPVVIYIHGGGWLSGDKSDVNQYADELLARGMAVAGINYRYSQHAQFPAQLHDCKGAIRWLRAHAVEYDLDPNRFAVFGESSGGHLAALIGLTNGNSALEGNVGGNVAYSSGVDCMVDVHGQTDLFALVAQGTSMATESQLIGRSVPEIYANINSPAYASWVSLVLSASPTTHASPDDPPALILHGPNDAVVPFSQSELLFDAMLNDGVVATLQSMSGYGHELPDAYLLQLYDFLQQHLDVVPSEEVVDVLGGTESGEGFGTSIAIVDDVNGDNINDLLIGAPFNSLKGVSAGRATLHSGATGLVLRTFYGRTRGDQFGFSVASAGDVNGDGRGDVIIGAPGFDGAGADSGRVYLFSGGNGSVLRTWTGLAAADRFGRAVAGPGDVNGDGAPDVLIGAPFADIKGSASGSATLFSGSNGSKLLHLNGHRAGDKFGQALCGVGDLNGDGRSEFMIASPYFDPSSSRTNAGRVAVHGKTGSQWVTRLILYGQNAGDWLGFAMSGPGDLDGDGVPDLAIGAPGHDGEAVNNGQLRVYSGTNGQLLRSVSPPTAQAEQKFGYAVAGLPDANSDGRPDLAVGCGMFHTAGVNVGRVVVLADSGSTVAKSVLGTLANSQFGICLAGGLEVGPNSEMVVGCPSMRINGSNSGACLLYLTTEE